MKRLISKIIGNKIFSYVITRYFTYFIQFLTTFLLAYKLGIHGYGKLSFILLLINYLQLLNFGIANSINILLVQYKDDIEKINSITRASYLMISILGMAILLLGPLYDILNIGIFSKYEVGKSFYMVCIICVFFHVNQLMMTIYRVKNRLTEISISQSTIPFISFVILFLFEGEKLIYATLAAYIVGYSINIGIFIKGGMLSSIGKVNIQSIRAIFKKGIYLFFYNLIFYLIMVSIRTLISIYYSVEDFGQFTFSFTVSNAFFLILEAFNFILFPKMIDKLTSKNENEILQVIKRIEINYVLLSHIMIYLSVSLLYIICFFFPKYSNLYLSFTLISFTILLYNTSFAYNTYLMAQNREGLLTVFVTVAQLVNISIAFLLIRLFYVRYEYVVLSTIISYFLFALLSAFFSFRLLGLRFSLATTITQIFPYKLFFPYLLTLTMVIFGLGYGIFFSFIILLALNIDSIRTIISSLKLLTNNDDVINITLKS